MRSLIALSIMMMLAGLSYASELTIGLIPERNVFEQMKRYQPLGEYIEKKSGIGIRFTVLPRYGNIIERFERNKLDGAFWGSFTGAMAIRKLKIEPIARPVNLDGTSSYRGYIFVRKDSRITSVDDMRHASIAFVDKATTAGYVFPIAYFKDHGVLRMNSHFKESYFTGSHDAAIYAVLNKNAQVGCAKNTIFDMLALQDARMNEDLVILARSADVPSNALGFRPDLAPDIKARIKQVLLEMDSDMEGRVVLDNFGVIKFIETTEADYGPVFDLARKAGINLKVYEYKND